MRALFRTAFPNAELIGQALNQLNRSHSERVFLADCSGHLFRMLAHLLYKIHAQLVELLLNMRKALFLAGKLALQPLENMHQLITSHCAHCSITPE